jgi:hypothetical protein
VRSRRQLEAATHGVDEVANTSDLDHQADVDDGVAAMVDVSSETLPLTVDVGRPPQSPPTESGTPQPSLSPAPR